MKRLKIINGRDANDSHVLDCVEIDKIVYRDIFQGIADNCLAWFHKNPDIYIFIVDEDTNKTIGYVNAMPITQGLHDKLMSKDIPDTEIGIDDILTYEDGLHYILYFCSIVVHPDYQGTKAFTTLYDAFITLLTYLASRNIYIDTIIAEGVSAKGSRICRLSGFEKVEETSEGSVLYNLDLQEGRFKPLSSVAENLKQLYTKSK